MSNTEPAAATSANPGAAPSLPLLSRRLARLAVLQSGLAVVPLLAALAVTAWAELSGNDGAWAGLTYLVGGAATVGLTIGGARRVRAAEARLVVAAEDLDRRSRARASELARANAELARVGRQRSEFFASMSHELRTPLNGILGYSRVLLDGLDGELTPEQREDVGQILASGQGLLSIVNDVLDFSKLEAGRIEFRREPVQLRIVVDDVLGRVQPLAAEKGLTLVNALPADLPPALADENRALQVMLNLLANAIKFSDDGSITVAGGLLDGAVHLSVADRGIGIPAEAHELIFEPFRQADQRDTRRHGGTGLGLAICRQLVVGMGGRIWLESAFGRGTTVHVTLPIADGGPGHPDGPAGAANPVALALLGRGEQDASLARECEREGLTPLVLDDAGGLRDALTRRHPALALFDLGLPRAAGWQAFHALRADPGGRAVPAVLYAANGARSVGVAVGPTGCVLRPAIGTELVDRLEELIERDGAEGPSSGPRTVLLVTGDALLDAPIRERLEPAGYDVCRATSGSEAVALLRGHRFSGAVIDLLVPGGALSTLAELRDGGPPDSVPIVLVSPPALSPGQQRALYRDVLDIVRRRGDDGRPAADAIRRALVERGRAAVAAGGR